MVNKQCEICGSKENLEKHHINGGKRKHRVGCHYFKQWLQEGKTKVYLCHQCHKRIHSIKESFKEEVTKKQIQSYLLIRLKQLHMVVDGLSRSKKIAKDWNQEDDVELIKAKFRLKECDSVNLICKDGKKPFSIEYYIKGCEKDIKKMIENREKFNTG